jgi:RNA polymerase primary sigma factor
MRRVLVLRFGLGDQAPKTLEELSAELGITRQRISQLEKRALEQLSTTAAHLRHYLRAD